MALFTSQILTRKGEALLAKAMGGRETTFTRIALGDGQLSGQSPMELEALISQKVSLPIGESYREDNSTWTVGASFDNKDLQVGFYWRETGVFAQDPDEGEILFSYASAQNAPDYIPPLTGGRWEKQIYVSEKVSSVANITVDASGSVLYLPREDFVNHLQSPLHTYPVTAAFTEAGVLELTGENLPADKDGLTVQFVSPAASTEGLQAKFAGEDTQYPILTTGEDKAPIQSGAFGEGVPVILTISGGKAFFKSGGAGINDNLPAQVTAFKAIDSSSGSVPKVTISWQNPTEYFSGVLIVKKAGSAPTGLNDGEKIYNGTGTTFEDTAVEFNTMYYYRVYPYKEKKQYQTLENVVSVTLVAWKMPVFTGSGYASGNEQKGEYRCLSSGTLTLDAQTYDVFVVGGGASGKSPPALEDTYGAAGGGSGYVTTKKQISFVGGNCSVIIGSGGGSVTSGGDSPNSNPGGQSSVVIAGQTITAEGGTNQGYNTGYQYGTNGGSGGGNCGYDGGAAGEGGADGGDGKAGAGWNNSSRTSKGSGTTTRAFSEMSNSLFAGGGGGGGGGDSGSQGASGGLGGGGHGGNYRGNGYAGTANTGGGGGGSGCSRSWTSYSGAGGSGIVIIRWGY